jgi:SAM-dependent methyltransferase
MTIPDEAHVERAVAACYSTWADNYFDLYYGDEAPYPPVHADIIRDMLLADGVSSILDAGCGPASFLRHISDTYLEWHGFDLTPEMVEEAARVAKRLERPASETWVGSVLDDHAFRSPNGAVFDGAVMVGVLPHVPSEHDGAVLRRLHDAVTPGGTLIAEARNGLFGLFSLNRPSFTLFSETLIGWDTLQGQADADEAATLTGLREALAARFRMDLPPIRPGQSGQQGYDEVLSRTHVPFELAECARGAGWVDVSLHYAHFHALPPMFERVVPKVFRSASLAMENPNDWRGVVMASTVIVKGRRAA